MNFRFQNIPLPSRETLRRYRTHAIVTACVLGGIGIVVFGYFFSHTPKNAKAASGYQYYRAITVTSTTSVASGTLTSFPMLVSSTLSSWESTSHGGHVQNLATAPSGGQEAADLVFATSTANCGTANLNFETEAYSSSTGALDAWVNVPTMQAGAVIYACYDNSAITTDQSHPSSTWNSNYKAVWHLPNGTSLSLNDSTANGINGTNDGATATTGQIAGGAAFNGSSQYIDDAMTISYGTFTAEAWFESSNVSNSNSRIVANSHTDTDEKGFQLMFNSGGANGFFDVGNGSANISASWTHTISNGTWYQYIGTYDGTYARAYINGVLVASSTASSGALSASGVDVNIGRNGAYAGDYLAGAADEVRILNSALSSQWILTEYNNQSAPSSFYAMGSETAINNTYQYYRAITVTSTTSVASGTLTSFPMLVSSTLASWESTSNGGKIQDVVTAPNGGLEPADLIFTTSTPTSGSGGWNCGTPLNFETESYSSSTGALVDWVSVPTMQAGAVIYACYDNNSVTTDQSHPSSTWNSNYLSVWHLDDSAANTTVADSKGLVNGTSAANTNTKTTTGEIDSGLTYNGSSDSTDSGNYGSPPNSVALEAWIKPNSAGGVIFSEDDSGWHDSQLEVETNNTIKGCMWTGGETCTVIGSGITYGQWYHVVMTYNATSTTLTGYVNGVQGTPTTATKQYPSILYYYLGGSDSTNGGDGNSFSGVIDEARVSNTALSSQWIATEYNNQANPSTFYAMGSETGVVNAYQYYSSITVTSTTSVASGTNSNFPMLVSSTISSWESATHGGKIQNIVTAPNFGPEPADLIFTTSTPTLGSSGWNCGASLNFETESYSSSTGALVDWVNVPTLQAGTVIYACYDNAAVATDQSSPANTWNPNYEGVWHLSNGTALNFNDSTVNGNNGSNSGSATATSSQIALGAYTNGSGSHFALPLPALSDTSNWTLSMWAEQDNSASYNTIFDSSDGTRSVGLFFNGSGASSYAGGATGGMGVSGGMALGTIHLLTFVHNYINSGNIPNNTYFDGQLNTQNNENVPNFSGGNVDFGDNPSGGGSNWQGKYDEIRVVNTILSPSWILSEYNNQSSPSTFYTIGNPVLGSNNAVLLVTTSTSLSFSGAVSGASSTQNVTVLNNASSGMNNLYWSATSTASWLTFSAASGTLSPGSSTSLGLIATPGALATGTYNATATIQDASATGSPVYLPISFTISTVAAATGTLDSATYDTGVASGAQINSIMWQGSLPTSTAVNFQIAVSNASSGPWNFTGPAGTTSTTDLWSGGNPGVPVPLSNYAQYQNYRYFRYRVYLTSNTNQTASPVVNDVIISWSP